MNFCKDCKHNSPGGRFCKIEPYGNRNIEMYVSGGNSQNGWSTCTSVRSKYGAECPMYEKANWVYKNFKVFLPQ